MLAQGAAFRRLEIIPVGRKHFVECVGRGQNDFGDESGIFACEFRTQHVFQVVCQLAELAIAASGRIAFQRMHGAANTAQTLGIARAPLERQAGFIHGLQNLRGALEEEVAKFVGAVVGQKAH